MIAGHQSEWLCPTTYLHWVNAEILGVTDW